MRNALPFRHFAEPHSSDELRQARFEGGCASRTRALEARALLVNGNVLGPLRQFLRRSSRRARNIRLAALGSVRGARVCAITGSFGSFCGVPRVARATFASLRSAQRATLGTISFRFACELFSKKVKLVMDWEKARV